MNSFRKYGRSVTCLLLAMATLLGFASEKPTETAHPGLLDLKQATAKAPDTFKVKFDTTKGAFTVAVHRDWAPLGVDRFYNMVKVGFFEDVAFYRVVKGFVVQFGFSSDPAVNKAWGEAYVKDDPPKMSNTMGRITFAHRGPSTRTTQLFINIGDNTNTINSKTFPPFGEVVEGMEVVQQLYGGYGEGAPYGAGPDQRSISTKGGEYLKARFPNLDYIKKAQIVE